MVRTATNVAGQALVPVIVSAREEILDRERYDSPRNDVPGADHTRLDVKEPVGSSA